MTYPSELQVGECIYPVEYFNVLKARSSVRIKKGMVILKLSRFVQGSKRDEVVGRFLKWACKRLSKVVKSDFVTPVYKDGGRIVIHNKVYELNVVPGDRFGGSNDLCSNSESRGELKLRAILKHGNLIQIHIPADLTISAAQKIIQNLAEKIIINDQTSYLHDVLNELNQLYFQEKFNGCRFKRMNSRFGSCSSRRNINIAFRLLFVPREVFRYVCVHELAHLKKFNHSKRFWDLVAEAMPDYKEYEKWLKNNGLMLG